MNIRRKITIVSILIAYAMTGLSFGIYTQELDYVCYAYHNGGISSFSGNGFPIQYYLHKTDSECNDTKHHQFDESLDGKLHKFIGFGLGSSYINVVGITIDFITYFVAVYLLANIIYIVKIRTNNDKS